MNDAREIASVVQNYFRIIKAAHTAPVKAFLHTCQAHTIRVGNNDYRYYRRGTGPTVVLVHGLHSHLGSMVTLAEDLLEQGFAVVLFDAPAHGEAVGTSTTPPQVRQFIRELSGQLGELHAVICHSLGGVWALSAWSPDFCAKTLVAVASPANHRFLVTKFVALNQIRSEIAKDLVKQLERRFGASLWVEYSPLEIVKTINTPGLIIHGQNDEFVPPEHAAQLHASWPGSSIKMIAESGHFEIMESPQVRQLIGAHLRQF